MNFVVLTADYPPIEGGISTVALQFSRELAALGHTVTVVAPQFPEQEAFDEHEPYAVVRFSGYRLSWARVLPMFAAARPHLRGADWVIAINASHGGLIAWLLRKRFVTFAYAYEFMRFRRNGPAAHVLRRVYASAARVVSISRFTTENLIAFGVNPSRVETINPGATTSAPLQPASLDAVKQDYVIDTERVILAVGRFISRKRHITLVRSMPRILARYPDTLLIMVGQGPTLSEVLREANALGVREQVLCPGRVSDETLAALYALCTVFALPVGADANGHVEGFGLVFTEAHAHGKPVVAGRSGGVVDAVLDGETGLLVEPSDPNALADAILSLFDNLAEAQRLGENGRRRVETELNWSVFTRKVLATLGVDA